MNVCDLRQCCVSAGHRQNISATRPPAPLAGSRRTFKVLKIKLPLRLRPQGTWWRSLSALLLWRGCESNFPYPVHYYYYYYYYYVSEWFYFQGPDSVLKRLFFLCVAFRDYLTFQGFLSPFVFFSLSSSASAPDDWSCCNYENIQFFFSFFCESVANIYE